MHDSWGTKEARQRAGRHAGRVLGDTETPTGDACRKGLQR